jgi:hypothetical protein
MSGRTTSTTSSPAASTSVTFLFYIPFHQTTSSFDLLHASSYLPLRISLYFHHHWALIPSRPCVCQPSSLNLTPSEFKLNHSLISTIARDEPVSDSPTASVVPLSIFVFFRVDEDARNLAKANHISIFSKLEAAPLPAFPKHKSHFAFQAISFSSLRTRCSCT